MRFGPRPPHKEATPSMPTATLAARRKAEREALATAPRVVDFESTAVNLRGVGVDPELCTELCAALKVNDTVAEIELGRNTIGDTGAEELGNLLAANANITTLGVAHNEITEWGAVCIARGSKKLNTLQSLNLTGNPIGDGGLIEIGRVLQQSSQIRELVLTDTNITFQGVVAFLELALSNYTLLYLALPYSLGYQLIEEAEKLLRRNWARLHKLDDKVEVAETLVKQLNVQEDNRQRQWERKQAVADHPQARTRTAEANIKDWSDNVIAPSLMMLSLLDAKSKQEAEDVEERRSLRDSHRASVGLRSGASSTVPSLPALSSARGGSSLVSTPRTPRSRRM